MIILYWLQEAYERQVYEDMKGPEALDECSLWLPRLRFSRLCSAQDLIRDIPGLSEDLRGRLQHFWQFLAHVNVARGLCSVSQGSHSCAEM